MNILFTTHQGELAGATFSIFYLARGLAEKGHHVHVVCRRGILLWKKLESAPNVTLHNLKISNYLDFTFCFRLKEIVRKNNITILNAQGGKDRNLVILAKWFFGLSCKIVFTRRQRPRDEPWIKRWFHTTGTSKIVMISNGLKEIFIKKGYNSQHLHVIHNGVPDDITIQLNVDKIEEIKNQLNLGDNIVIGCVSRKKSQEQLIEAFKFLPDGYAGLFVGISENEIAQHLRTSIVHPMRFTGIVSHEEAMHYLKLMDVNVLPSYLDGFGLVLVESMLMKVPVIGSNFGGIPDIIQNGENGFLFENGDPKELADKILQVTSSNTLRGQFVSKGLNDARQKFSVSKMVSEYERLFESLLAK